MHLQNYFSRLSFFLWRSADRALNPNFMLVLFFFSWGLEVVHPLRSNTDNVTIDRLSRTHLLKSPFFSPFVCADTAEKPPHRSITEA